MSYFIAVPDELALAATELDSIGTTLSAANVAAVLPTTGIPAAGADDVSMAIAALFAGHAQAYQALSTAASTFHTQFVRALNLSGGAYAAADAANASPLQTLEQDLLGVLNAPTQALLGRPLIGAGADGTAPGQGGGAGGLLYGNGGSGAAGTNTGWPGSRRGRRADRQRRLRWRRRRCGRGAGGNGAGCSAPVATAASEEPPPVSVPVAPVALVAMAAGCTAVAARAVTAGSPKAATAEPVAQAGTPGCSAPADLLGPVVRVRRAVLPVRTSPVALAAPEATVGCSMAPAGPADSVGTAGWAAPAELVVAAGGRTGGRRRRRRNGGPVWASWVRTAATVAAEARAVCWWVPAGLEALVATAGATSAFPWGQVGSAAMAGRVARVGGSMATAAAAVPADPVRTDSGRSVALAGPAGAVVMPG
ncbi:hypothetical protein MMRN_44110 [Mycobacterium marinum]|nr:hypothetical protein MMRN_44110 [Mycobacterium marinum]